jgi:hypothetical protein
MHRPFLSLVAYVTIAGCSRSAAPAEAPAPASSPDTALTPPVRPAPAPSTTSAAVDRAGVEREFRGAYTRGFEASWFAPCDASFGDALWWVTLTEPARLQRDSMLKALTQAPTGALAVRWRGTISARMPAGHMGRGTRYLLVTEVLDVQPLRGESACPPMSRPS